MPSRMIFVNLAVAGLAGGRTGFWWGWGRDRSGGSGPAAAGDDAWDGFRWE